MYYIFHSLVEGNFHISHTIKTFNYTVFHDLGLVHLEGMENLKSILPKVEAAVIGMSLLFNLIFLTTLYYYMECNFFRDI